MYYKLNAKTLTYEKTNLIRFKIKYIGGIVLILSLLSLKPYTSEKHYTTEELVVLERDVDKFTPEKFKAYLKELNIRHADIVYAQAVLETDSFTSDVFIENSNLFGLKMPERRPTTANGVNRGHAYYKYGWRSSVQDYALYQAAYLRNANREEYLAFLDAKYSEIGNEYSKRLKLK